MNWSRGSADFRFGFFAGFLFGGSIVTLATALVVLATATAWLQKWQTLVAGLLALAGAIATVVMIQKQIAQSEFQAEQRRSRRNLAARAMLPTALSRLSGYAQECIEALKPAYVPGLMDEVQRRPIEIPPLPEGDLTTIKECVEFGDDAVQHVIADLLSRLQVQHSRLVDLAAWPQGRAVHGHNILVFLVDALEIYARCSALFDYARRESDAVEREPTREALHNAAGIAQIRRHDFAQLCDWIDRHYPAGEKADDGDEVAAQQL